MLVGNDISSYAIPKSIKMIKGNKNGTLVLEIKRGDEINIEYSKTEIIDKINSYFGYKLINEIRIKYFNLENKKAKKKHMLKKFSNNFEKKNKRN